MPRAMDRRLAMAHERANPVTRFMVDVSRPDVEQVLRRAADQFLASPPLVSQTPSNTLQASPAGALTLNSGTQTLASFTHDDDYTTTHVDADGLSSDQVRGLCWTVDPAFGRAVLKKMTIHIKRELIGGFFRPSNAIGVQIYRRDNAGRAGIPFSESVWTPMLANPVWWRPKAGSFSPFNDVAVPEPFFDFTGLNVVLGAGDGPNARTEYYFVLSIDQGQDNYYLWPRDRTAARTIAGVGTFSDRQWFIRSGTKPSAWTEDLTLPAAVPVATIEVEQFATTSTAIYAIDLGAVPSEESVGRVVFERGVPDGTTAALALSTAGSSGPWTTVTDGDVVNVKQQTYHLRATLTAPASGNLAPHISAMGIQFRREIDVSAEASVQPIPQQIDAPYCAAGIGEGSVSVVRTGVRDYRDVATEIAIGSPVTQLEVDVRLGTNNPVAPRDAWMLLDRATANGRTPSSGSEQFSLLSALQRTKQKIPTRAETFSTVHTVVSCSTSGATPITSLVVTPAIPLAGVSHAYLSQGYYLRVRSSAQTGVESGFVAVIYDNGVGSTLLFKDDDGTQVLPGNLIAGDVIEIHSARFARPTLTWKDADLADIWWEILTVWLDTPPEDIGRGDMGHGGRAGLPPRVEDIEPGDDDAQSLRLVSITLKSDESAASLLNQISFLLGGATVAIGGQICYRQIYALRNASGDVTVSPDPISATFDARDLIGLQTPTGVEQRMSQLACNYGVDTTAGDDTTAAPLTAVTVDVDALAYYDTLPIDEMAPAAVPDEIARWCYNSADGGLYLASKTTEMVVRACSTGLRLWPWRATEMHPRLVVGDRVAVVTDQYTDFDPSRGVTISGPTAYALTLVSVADAGQSFVGWLQSLTDAVPVQGGPGSLDQPPGADSGEILSVTFEDSPDGTNRTYDVTCGSAVAALYVHHRLWLVGTQGDPFDFSDPDDLGELIVVSADVVDGHFHFTLDHPDRTQQRFGVFVPRRGLPDFVPGADVYKIVLDPAPPAMSAKMHVTVTNDLASVSSVVTAGVSDWPVRVRIYEGSPNTTPLVDTTISAPTTLDASSFAVLAGRLLPLRELLSWWTQLTNVAGEEVWGGPEAADRDALPTGYLQLEQNRADAKIRMVFDDDTDTIRVTVPGGRTKTWNAAALALAGSPVVYTVGDVLDDTTTESALVVDEKRSGYLVEYQGGGVWVTIAPPFVLTGPLSVVAMAVKVTPGPSSYSIEWSGVGVTVSLDGAGYGTPDPSPFTVTRDGSPHTLDFKQNTGNTAAPIHIDIPALPEGVAGSFSNMSMTLSFSNQITLAWAYAGSAFFDVYVSYDGAAFALNDTTGVGATTDAYMTPDTLGVGSTPVVVSAYLVPKIAGGYVGAPSAVFTDTFMKAP